MLKFLNILRERGIGDAFSELFESTVRSFSSFSIADAFSILLSAGLFFVLLLFLRSKKCGNITIGILSLLVVDAVAYAFGLDSFCAVFSPFLACGAVIVVLIYLSEFRDGFEQLGALIASGFTILSDKNRKEAAFNSAIDNICEAVKDLSNSRTGALIAIECNTRLDEIVSTGVVINADVNSFLLRNIFFNKAPLHDGAVIITNGRIRAAGCLLPLTHSIVDSDLGTRHRAAIGLSESSDSVVIVVSEETGIISVANDSSLSRGYSPESLKYFLSKKLVGTMSDTTN